MKEFLNKILDKEYGGCGLLVALFIVCGWIGNILVALIGAFAK